MSGDGTNFPPKFTSVLHDVNFIEGQPSSFSFPRTVVVDPEGQGLRFTWTVTALGPGGTTTWLTFSDSELTLQGTPPPNSPDYSIVVSVTDGANAPAVERFRLFTSAGSNQPPALALPLSEQTWAEGVASQFTLAEGTFADPNGDPLGYSARLASGAALPAWLSFNPSTRTFSGTAPAGSDDVALRVTATDPGGLSAAADVTLLTRTTAVLNGTAGVDTLQGTSGPDTINAGAGDDVIDAGAGDDTIDAGPGADRINAGTGTDAAVFPGSRGDYIVSRNASGVVTVADKFGTMDTLTDVETLQFAGASADTAGLAYLPSVVAAPSGQGNQVFRFYNVRDKAYFYTSIASEKDLVLRESTDPAYTPENGVWPYFYQGATFGQPGSGGVAVYRFYNTQTGHHFFTVSESERALVRRESTDPSYTPENGVWPFLDEGVGFVAYANGSAAASLPVFRFFSPTLNRHFFTANVEEAQQIRLTGLWSDEGTGFWAAPLSANRAPTVASPLADLSWGEGRAGSYQFPATSFTDADADPLSYSASLVSGAALPSWLTFSASTRTFSGTPPANTADLSLRVTVSDGKGGTASDDLVLATPSAGADDHPASSATTGRLAVGGSTTGTIETANDVDWFRISLSAGATYRIDLEGSGTSQGTLVDPFLHGVYNSGGKWQTDTSNGDVGSKNRNSRVSFTPSSNGDYFISAGGTGTGTGTYRLSVVLESGAADDFAATRSTTGSVQPGGAATGAIETSNDKDWFRVSLEGGRRYFIDLEGVDTSKGTLADPFIYGIYDSGGKSVANTSNDDDEAANTTNARVTFTPSSSGTYFIEAGAYGEYIGTYTLKVSSGSKGGSGDGTAANGFSFNAVVGPEATPAGLPVTLIGLSPAATDPVSGG